MPMSKLSMGRACSTLGKPKRCIQSLIGEPEGKRPFGRPRRIREDNIRMDIWGKGCEVVGWTQLPHDRDQ
jgi:hypothetical protein